MGHALSSWNSVALGWGGTNHLEEVLSDSEMVLLLLVLSNDGVNNGLQDVFLGHDTFHIFNEIIRFSSLIIFQIVNNQINSSLWDNINEWRKDLKCVLSLSEHNEVMSEQVIILNDISR